MKLSYTIPFDLEDRMINTISKLSEKISLKFNAVIDYVKTPVKIFKFEHNQSYTYLKFDIELKLPIIKYDGFSYVATLKKENGSLDNMVYCQDNNRNLSEYYKKDFRCDHCNTNRYRKTVHVFENENGKELMIASSCVKEYFGVDLENTLNEIMSFYKINDFNEINEICGSFNCKGYDVQEYAKICAGVLLKRGQYISKKISQDDTSKCSTADQARYYFIKPDFGGYNAKENAKAWFNEKEKIIQLAKDFDYNNILEYWETMPESDTFSHNIKTSLYMVEPKEGFIAYAVFKYYNDVLDFTGRKIKAEKAMNSEYQGSIGDKINADITVINVSEIEGGYGITSIINMIDNNGNLYTWFASGYKGLEKNEKFSLIGTVKKHDTYNGNKITFLTRCKLKS